MLNILYYIIIIFIIIFIIIIIIIIIFQLSWFAGKKFSQSGWKFEKMFYLVHTSPRFVSKYYKILHTCMQARIYAKAQ